MSDLRERAPATSAMQKLLSYRGTPDIRELPFGMIRISNEALMWLRGVRGELFMADRLRTLGPEWVVLHSVQVDRYSDIDHIVIGPPGVFPINTKRLIGREVVVTGDVFRSDGWRKQYLAKSEIEARRVDAILRRAQIAAKVLPIIAISGASKVKVKSDPHWKGRTIGVAPVEKVASRLRKRAPRLEADEVARIANVLADSESWMRRSAPDDPPDDLLPAYQAIDRGISRLNFVTRSVGVLLMAASVVGLGFWINWFVAPGVAAHIASLFER